MKRQSTEKKTPRVAKQTKLVPSILDWNYTNGSVLTGIFNGVSLSDSLPKLGDKEPKEKFQNIETTDKKRIAAFDFDGTIANVNGTHTFPKNGEDWVWFSQQVPRILIQLAQNGFILAIISNQKGIQTSPHRYDAFVGRVEKTAKELIKYCKSEKILQVPPFYVLAATLGDEFRKPMPGMWSCFQKRFGFQNSKLVFYCGDAAGRFPKDHSDTDRKWALNLQIPFFVPEDIFGPSILFNTANAVESLKTSQLPPLAFNHENFTSNLFDVQMAQKLRDYDIIVLLGPPAAGKSTFCQLYLGGHTRINQDTLKSADKCLKAAREALNKNEKIVVDNTNPRRETRIKYRKLAPHKSAACVFFDLDRGLVKHNNAFREFAHSVSKIMERPAVLDFSPKHVPTMAMNLFYKNLEEPSSDLEGYEMTFTVKGLPGPLDEKLADMWELHYC